VFHSVLIPPDFLAPEIKISERKHPTGAGLRDKTYEKSRDDV
jgi:hypothetical protein